MEPRRAVHGGGDEELRGDGMSSALGADAREAGSTAHRLPAAPDPLPRQHTHGSERGKRPGAGPAVAGSLPGTTASGRLSDLTTAATGLGAAIWTAEAISLEQELS